MSTKNYAVSAVVLLLVLIASASALVVNDTQVNTTNPFKMFLVAADGTTPKGTLEIGPLGNMTFTGKVLFDGEGTGDPNTCKLVVNGGTCTMSYDESESVRFPDKYGPVEIWVNAGTLTVDNFQNNIPYKPGGGGIYIGGGNLIVQSGYAPGDPNNPVSNPALWEANGTMKPQSGYTIAYQNMGGGAVRIYGMPLLYNPTPADNDSISNLNLPSLKWDTLGVQVCKVWFGQAAATKDDYKTTLTYIGNTGLVSLLDPDGDSVEFAITSQLPLSGDTFTGKIYSWAVEGYEKVAGGEPNNLLGVAIFKFYSLTRPVVKIPPTTQYKLAGETAVFTAEVESNTALTAWNWYKTSAPTTPIAGTKVDLGNKRYRLTLTVPSVGWASQGQYYCRPVNSAGQVNSVQATLVVKTLVAHWAFENNLLDTAPKTVHTTVYNGTAAVTPSYVASSGVDTQALSFDGTNQYVTLPAGFADFSTGVTFAVWGVMDADVVKSYARYVDFAQDAGSTFANSVNFCRRSTSNDLQFRTGNNQYAVNAIRYDQWQHIVVTMDVGGDLKFYIDGALFGTGLGSIPQNVVRQWNYIGEQNLAGPGSKFKGKMGDLRVYNYAVSAEEVKNLYAEMHGPFCGNRPALDIDQTGSSNCVVDLADLAVFASKWLGCGRWPDTACP